MGVIFLFIGEYNEVSIILFLRGSLLLLFMNKLSFYYKNALFLLISLLLPLLALGGFLQRCCAPTKLHIIASRIPLHYLTFLLGTACLLPCLPKGHTTLSLSRSGFTFWRFKVCMSSLFV